MSLTLSQIIYGVRDLDTATARIAAHGLTVVESGVHPGLAGTDARRSRMAATLVRRCSAAVARGGGRAWPASRQLAHTL